MPWREKNNIYYGASLKGALDGPVWSALYIFFREPSRCGVKGRVYMRLVPQWIRQNIACNFRFWLLGYPGVWKMRYWRKTPY